MSPDHPQVGQTTASDLHAEPRADPPTHVRGVIQTGAVFSVLLEHLNRRSTAALFDELIAEVNRHCERLKEQPSQDASALRSELASLLPLIQRAATQQRQDFTLIEQSLTQAADLVGERLERRMTAMIQLELSQLSQRLTHQTVSSGQRARHRWAWPPLVSALLIVAALWFWMGLLIAQYALATLH